MTPKLGLEFRPRDGVMVYGAVTTGYKSGGFNSISLQPSFDEEKITSYEVGVKSRSSGGVTFNASAFSYDYDDLQVAVLFPDRSTVENAASARIRGLDVELLVRPNPRFGFDLSFEILDDEFREFTSQNPTDVASLQDRFLEAGTLDVATLLGAGYLIEPSDQTGKDCRARPTSPPPPRFAMPSTLGPPVPSSPRRVPVHGRHRVRSLRELHPALTRFAARPTALDADLRAALRRSLRTQSRRRGVPPDRVLHHLHGFPARLAPPREVGVQLGFDF